MTDSPNRQFHKYSSIITLDAVDACIETLQSDVVSAVGATFRENCDVLESSALLPVLLVAKAVHRTEWIERFRFTLVKHFGHESKPGDDDPRWDVVREEMKARNDSRAKDNQDWSFTILDELVEEDDEIAPSVESLFRLLTVHAWTILEATSCELGSAAVPASPNTAAKAAFFAKRDSVSKELVNRFAEQGFSGGIDVSIGDFLVPYYDFSGITDIVKTYKSAFGKDFAVATQELNANTDLRELQASRNLIVHRGGLVDPAFIAITGSNAEIGSMLEIDGHALARLTRASTDAVCGLLKFADSWLVSHESEEHDTV